MLERIEALFTDILTKEEERKKKEKEIFLLSTSSDPPSSSSLPLDPALISYPLEMSTKPTFIYLIEEPLLEEASYYSKS